MAYGLRKYAEFTDDFGQDWKVEIQERGYVGGSTEFTLASDGFQLRYQGQGQALYESIKASEVTIGYYSQGSSDDTLLINISNADPMKFVMKLYKSDVLYWQGNIILESAEIVDLYYPQMYQLRAIDGLGALKDYTVEDLNYCRNIQDGSVGEFAIWNSTYGSNWQGEIYTLGSLLISCLQALPTSELWNSETFARLIFSWEEDSMGATTQYKDPFNSTALRSDLWYKISNSEDIKYKKLDYVVKEILRIFNARIFQANGEWVIIQTSAYHGMLTTSQKYARYDKTATFLGTGSINLIGDDITAATSPHRKAEAVNTYTPALRTVTITTNGGDLWDQNWSAPFKSWNETHTLDADSTPILAAYRSTFVQATEAFAGYTFNFGMAITKTSNLTSADYPGLDNGSYIYQIIVRKIIKAGSKYLRSKADLTGWEWTDTQAHLFTLHNDETWAENIQPGATTGGNMFDYGDYDPTVMDQLESTDQVEYYSYYRIYKLNTSTWTLSDCTGDFDEADHTVKYEKVGGWTSINRECVLFKDGETVKGDTTIVTNSPGGTIIEGGIDIEQDLICTNSSNQVTYGDLLVWTDPPNWGAYTSWPGGQRQWNNYNTVTTELDISAMKGVDMIAMQTTGNPVLQASILRTSQYSTTDVVDFRKALNIDGDCYVPAGLTFSAREGKTTGEWEKITYDETSSLHSSDATAIWMQEAFFDFEGNSVFNWGWSGW